VALQYVGVLHREYVAGGAPLPLGKGHRRMITCVAPCPRHGGELAQPAQRYVIHYDQHVEVGPLRNVLGAASRGGSVQHHRAQRSAIGGAELGYQLIKCHRDLQGLPAAATTAPATKSTPAAGKATKATSPAPRDEEREAAATTPAAATATKITQHDDHEDDRQEDHLRRETTATRLGRRFGLRRVQRGVEREMELVREALSREERQQLDAAPVILLLEE